MIIWFNKWINNKDSKFDYASWGLDHLNYSPNFFDKLATQLEEKGFKCCFEFKSKTEITPKTDYFTISPYFTISLPTYNPRYVTTYEDIKLFLCDNDGLFKYISLKGDGFKKDYPYVVYNITN